MKVLQVIDTLAVGGAERVLVTLANLQNKHEDSVAVLTLLEPGELVSELNPSIPIWSLYRKWKFNPLTMFKYVQIAKEFNLVHVHSAHNLRYTYIAFSLFGLKVPIVFHEHSGKINMESPVKWHQGIMYPKIYFVGVSETLCAWARSKIGVPHDRVFLLSNIVPNYPLAVRQKKTKGNTLKIVMVGNIRRLKNIEFGIKLLQKIEELRPSTLTVIGKISDRQYFQEVLELIKKLGLENVVTFEHNCSNVQPLLSNFDIAIHPAHYESGPLVLIEYLGQGIPFVVHDVGEVTSTVKREYPEYVIDNLEINIWKDKLLEVLEVSGEARKRKLRQFYEENYSEQTYYQKCTSIYEKALLS